jgi:hypothetical protein
MQLARRDPDLRAHPELAAIGELGRGVAHQDRAVEPLEKPRGGGVVLGQDALGMGGAVGPDMRDRRVDIVDDPSPR